jgi:hypothetical protein
MKTIFIANSIPAWETDSDWYYDTKFTFSYIKMNLRPENKNRF